MKLETIKKLSQKYLDKCEEVYGYSKFQECSPYLDFEKSIYARLSGIEDMEGEDNPDAEYCSMDNAIIIYYPKIKSKKHLAQTIVHEYQHYLQSTSWMTRYYRMGHNYSDHPYEIAANKEEINWEKVV